MDDFVYEGFEELEEHGFECVYINIKNKKITPAFGLQHLLNKDFYPKGTKVRFVNHNGYEFERERAAKEFDIEKAYTVKRCRVGSSSSRYQFEEVDGEWNTVMFKKI